MIKLFVCEDNDIQRCKFRKIIEDNLIIENYDMKFALDTKDPSELINYVKENKGIGLYFLDVDLKANINGIQLAKKIREYDINGFIIFLTSHAEMSYLTFVYKIEAMDYIIKDNYKNIKERIIECIKYANKKYSNDSNAKEIITITSDEKIINLEYNDILYFETADSIHKIIAHCVDRNVEFYGKMKELEKRLKDKKFSRCHTSFILNQKYIKEIDKKNRIAYMVNGDKCLISTRGIKTLL